MKNGFHLVEILSVIAILSILCSLCLPLYGQYLVQARRLEATIALSQLALAMEQFHIEHNSYEGATLSTLHFSDNIGKNNYHLRMEVTNNDYKLIAQPLGRQAEKDSHCGELILLANNEKAVSGLGSARECWQDE